MIGNHRKEYPSGIDSIVNMSLYHPILISGTVVINAGDESGLTIFKKTKTPLGAITNEDFLL